MVSKYKKPLFDITLTNPTTQIELNGITDMIEENKLYVIFHCGTTSSSNGYVAEFLGTGNSIYTVWESGNSYIGHIAYFAKIKYGNQYKLIVFGYDGSSWNTFTYNISDEYLKMASTSYSFISGTHIIIKEVA